MLLNRTGEYYKSIRTAQSGTSLSEPYINVKFVNSVCLSVCLSFFLSVCTFMTRKFTRVVLIYGVSSVVDCGVYGTNKIIISPSAIGAPVSVT